MDIKIRKAEINDVSALNTMIYRLAYYENFSDLCTLDDDTLAKLMTEPNGLQALIAEKNEKAVGMLTYYFFKIATFSGKSVLYIEDIFIDENLRRRV